MDAHGSGNVDALQKAMESILLELQEGLGLRAKQNKEGLPNIFLEAKEKYRDESNADQTAGENTADDDDDVIIILDEEEVRNLRAQNRDSTSSGLDTAGPVIEMT